MHVGSSQGCQRRFPPHFASDEEEPMRLFEQYMEPEEPLHFPPTAPSLLTQVYGRAARTASDH